MTVFGPKRLAERSIASIAGTVATSWLTALACDVGGRKILPNIKELTGGRLHALVHGFRQEKSPMELCLCQRGWIPLPCSIRTLVVLVVLAAEQVLTRSSSQRLVALASK